MNNLREALEAIARQPTIAELPDALGMELGSDEIDVAEGYDGIINMARQALQSADTWREPDETTPDDAAVWKRTYTNGALGWLLTTYASVRNYADITLAKENQGPPPDDWKPDELTK